MERGLNDFNNYINEIFPFEYIQLPVFLFKPVGTGILTIVFNFEEPKEEGGKYCK